MPADSLIINHSPTGGGLRNVAGSLDYYMRTGAHEGRGGLDMEPTRYDVALERMRGSQIGEYVSYAAREGRYSGRNEELPMERGQVSGGCWDQMGIKDTAELKREIVDSGSDYVRTTISVKREDAAALNLRTKEDFQRLMRAEWAKHVEGWGIMEARDIRWAAFFHTDNPVNLHVHVITWDASGQLRDQGARTIPKENLMRSEAELRKVALRPLTARLSDERYFLREFIRARVDHDLGCRISEERAALLEEKRGRAGLEMSCRFDDRPVGRDEAAAVLDKVRGAAPEGHEGDKFPQYARCSEQVRQAAVKAIDDLRKLDPVLDRAFERREQSVREYAETLGYKNEVTPFEDGRFRNLHAELVKEAAVDMNKRAAQRVLAAANRSMRGERADERLREAGRDGGAAAHGRAIGSEYSRERQSDRQDAALSRQRVYERLSAARLTSREAVRASTRAARAGYAIARGIPAGRLDDINRALLSAREAKIRGNEEEAGRHIRSAARMVLRQPEVAARLSAECVAAHAARGSSSDDADFRAIRDEVHSYHLEHVSEQLERTVDADIQRGEMDAEAELGGLAQCIGQAMRGGQTPAGHGFRSAAGHERDRDRGIDGRLDESREKAPVGARDKAPSHGSGKRGR